MSAYSQPQEDARVSALLTYRSTVSFSGCRLVHYAGTGTPNSCDVLYEEVEAQVRGCLREGFNVGWQYNGRVLYIAAQEPDCPFPPWVKVFREEAIVDESEILKRAGFGNAA